MIKLKIAVLKGDGIGPEVINEAIKVLQAVAKKFEHQFTFEEALFLKLVNHCPKKPYPFVKTTIPFYLEPLGILILTTTRLQKLEKEIVENVDFKIYRELTGGIYFGEKKLSEDGQTASDLCSYSVIEIERVAHLAFQAAK